MVGTVSETYAAAISNDFARVGSATLVGVVRQPPRWFHGAVDENHRALGPPTELLDEFRDHRETLKAGGMCDEGAHNAAWEELDFERRYREYLEGDADASAAFESLLARLQDGESLALVCFEGETKACHRRPLLERFRDRLDGGE